MVVERVLDEDIRIRHNYNDTALVRMTEVLVVIIIRGHCDLVHGGL